MTQAGPLCLPLSSQSRTRTAMQRSSAPHSCQPPEHEMRTEVQAKTQRQPCVGEQKRLNTKIREQVRRQLEAAERRFTTAAREQRDAIGYKHVVSYQAIERGRARHASCSAPLACTFACLAPLVGGGDGCATFVLQRENRDVVGLFNSFVIDERIDDGAADH